MSPAATQLKDEGSPRQIAIAGAFAGLVSRFVIAPLDVIKIRLQLQIHALGDGQHGASTYPRGTIGTLKQILRDEGVTGFWKGNIPAEAMYLTYGTIQFSAYAYISHLLDALPQTYQLPSSVSSFVSGATAGACATTATYPLDLLRTRFAAQGRDRVYPSIVSSVRHIAEHEGPTGFFRGLGAGVSQIVPYMGLFFASYEGLKPVMADGNMMMPFGTSDAVAGTIASVLSKTAVYPLDTTRKRLQVQGPTRMRYAHGNIPVYQGILSTIGHIWRHEGRRGMYRGLTISLLKAAPTSAVTMWIYERAMGIMLAMEEGS